jgi:hypothetical protein
MREIAIPVAAARRITRVDAMAKQMLKMRDEILNGVLEALGADVSEREDGLVWNVTGGENSMVAKLELPQGARTVRP